MGKRKGNFPAIEKVEQNAISIRSSSMGICTAIFDAEFLPTLNECGFNPCTVAFTQKPQPHFEQLCDWARRGEWMAIASHPEILDSDGVPGLDLVFRSASEHNTVPEPPRQGNWSEAGSQILSIASGELMIVYDQEFFNDVSHQDEGRFVIESEEDQSFGNDEFVDSTCYLIPCEPGNYLASVCARNLYSDSTDGRYADLVVYLTPNASENLNEEANGILTAAF